MRCRTGSVIAAILIFAVMILLIVSLNQGDWYTFYQKDSQGDTFTLNMGLTQETECVGTGAALCLTETYADVVSQESSPKYKNDFMRVRAGGAMTIVFGSIFILISLIVVVLLSLHAAGEYLTARFPTTFNDRLMRKIPFTPFIVVFGLVFTLFWWVVLWPYQDLTNEAVQNGATAGIGSGIGILIAAFVLALIAGIAAVLMKTHTFSTPDTGNLGGPQPDGTAKPQQQAGGYPPQQQQQPVVVMVVPQQEPQQAPPGYYT